MGYAGQESAKLGQQLGRVFHYVLADYRPFRGRGSRRVFVVCKIIGSWR